MGPSEEEDIEDAEANAEFERTLKAAAEAEILKKVRLTAVTKIRKEQAEAMEAARREAADGTKVSTAMTTTTTKRG